MVDTETNYGVGGCWFLVIALMFFAQHHVCDAYFVPAINVFVDTMGKSKNKWLQRWGEEAVAGATICALGCNGPELFTNLIALYTGSDAGIGVVVGSEIFNLLIIIGCAILATPSQFLPLQLERVPFSRDCIFYGISIIMLYITLLDKRVDWNEAIMLLFAAAIYVVAVYFTTDVVQAVPCLQSSVVEVEDSEVEAAPTKRAKMHGVEVQIKELFHSRMADACSGPSEAFELEATGAGIYAQPIQDKAPNRKSVTGGSIGFQFDNPEALLGPILKYKDLKEVQIMEHGVIQLEFFHRMLHVTLMVTINDISKTDDLLKGIENNSAKYTNNKMYIHKYDASVFGAIGHLSHAMRHGSFVEKILSVPEFIVDAMLRSTLWWCDVKHIQRQRRWPLCFIGAMFWLAMFSWAMLEVAEQIHANIPALPNSFLGITVCAIGTSFPNAVASIIMAQQAKPAAAIANALGSNVQNVFLAMALPWTIFCFTQGVTQIPQNVAGINEGVFWMMGTLILVLFFVMLPTTCTLTKCNGLILIAVYVIYLTQVSGETFHYWNPVIQ